MSQSSRRHSWMLLLCLLPACGDCETEQVDDTPGSLKGTVCHHLTGRPVKDAEIQVTAAKSGSTTELKGKSDAEGKYTVGGIPPGEASVKMIAEGVSKEAFPVAVKSGLVTERLDPSCINAAAQVGKGCVSGQVCNRHTGGLVSNAEVTVILANVDYAGDASELTTTTATDGSFSMCGVPAGTHVVQVRANGFQKAYPAAVTEGETTVVVASSGCTAYDPRNYCTVTGRVCTSSTPPGWLNDARVTAQKLDAAGNLISPVISQEEEEFTDSDGRYEIFLRPEGKWRIQVQKGNFVSRHDVDCLVNEVTPIPEGQQCVTASECRFLVAQGTFDRVEQVLARVGVEEDAIDVIDGNPANFNEDWAFRAFGDYARLEGYCGVFFNCGINENAFFGPQKNPGVIANLKRFVEEGGTLYASDQSYDVVEAVFPAKVDWFRDDELASDAEYGTQGLVTAQVTDPSLLSFLQQDNPGQSSVVINFAYQSWSVAQFLDADVQVYLRANVNACADGEACTSSVLLADTPLTLRFPVGLLGGQVVFTSFHVESSPVTDADGGTATISTEDTDRVMRFLMTL